MAKCLFCCDDYLCCADGSAVGGGNSSYVLPPATRTRLGGVIVGDGLNVKSDGTLSVTLEGGETTTIATTLQAGLMSADDKSKLNGLENYTLRPATTTQLGGIKPGDGLYMNGEYLNVISSGTGSGGTVVSDYTLQPATETEIGGVKPGNGLSVQDDGTLDVTLSAGSGDGSGGSDYVLPSASRTQRGGGIKIGSGLEITNTDILNVKVGNGLKLNADGTLNVTALGSGGTYTTFTGATTSSSGKSGLVPEPPAGAQNKFLRGDGSWSTIEIGTGSGDTLSGVSVAQMASIQGGFWAEIHDGTPMLRLRYNDYIYNFIYDEVSYLGYDAGLPLSANVVGAGYTLNTIPSTVDGGLWYEVKETTPMLKMHSGSYDYIYNYSKLTYVGDNTGMVAYIPCDQLPPSDACNNTSTADLTTTNVIVVGNDYARLYQRDSSENEVLPLYGRAYTAAADLTATIQAAYADGIIPQISTTESYATDAWFYFTEDAIDYARSHKTSLPIFPCLSINSAGLLQITAANATANNAWTDAAINYANRRNHIAIYMKAPFTKEAHVAINGKYILHPKYNSYSTNPPLRLLNTSKKGAKFTFSSYIAFNKIRIFNKVIWESDFELPSPEDYL